MLITRFAREPEHKYVINVRYGNKDQYHTLKTNIYSLYWILARLKKGYSPIIGICGDQRDGKSWFAMFFAYFISGMMHKKFNINDNIVYGQADISVKLKQVENDVIVLDEASYSYYKREWFKKPHRFLSKIIFTQGRKSIAYIFVTPFINDVDKAFTKHFDIMISVKTRGIAKAYRIYKKHMAFTDRENRRWWWDDIKLDTKDMPIAFKRLLREYKKVSEQKKDEIEQKEEMEDKEEKKTFKQILRRA